jgi:hypothetical protein
VLWGRCWEAGGAPAYWPWIQTVRAARPDAPPEATDLGALLPGLGGGPAGGSGEDPERARFRLFDAATAFFDDAARARPLVLIIDDLHAADRPSLLLLRHLADEVATRRVLVVGAFRDLEVGPDHPLADDLASLGRAVSTLRLTLAGLERAEVARYLEARAGVDAAAALADRLHRETGGNPLYLAEVVRLLGAEGRLGQAGAPGPSAPLPRSVRDAIDRRLARLPADGHDVLACASVLGRELDLESLAAVADRPREELLGALDEAMAAGLLREDAAAPGRLRFSHALVRDALYEGLRPVRRAQLHLCAGAAIETADAGAGRRLAELAHHFSRSALAGGSERALEYARRAGEQALDGLAYEEAARLFEIALGALDGRDRAAERTRCELLVALGDARARAGEAAAAGDAFRRAAEVAEALGWAGGLARAALGYGGRLVWVPAAYSAPGLVELLERALAALPPGEDDPLRARVLARLGGALRDRPEREPRYSIAHEAVALARRLGDAATLAYVLDGAYAATWGPGEPERRRAAADELTRVAAAVGDLERALQGHLYGLLASLELGQMPSVRAGLARMGDIAAGLKQRGHEAYLGIAEGVLALFEGRFDLARALVDELRAEGLRSLGPWGTGSWFIQTVTLRRQTGPLDGLGAFVDRALDEFSSTSVIDCHLPIVYAETGREGDARDALVAVASQALTAFSIENDLLFGLGLVAEACALLGEPGPAPALYERLLPYAERNAVCPPVSASGSVRRPLGLLALLLGRADDAVAHLEAAVAANAAMGARPWVALAQLDLSQALRARGGPEDRRRAEGLIDAAAATAARLGMHPLADRLAAAGAEGAASRADGGAAAMLREGEYWSVSWEGRTFRLRDRVGLRYLARLLAEPGAEIHALDLVAAESGAGIDRAGGADAIDASAREAYRARLAELEEELDEARAWNDPERAARAEVERASLAEHLAGALGRGGRPRRLGSDAERARISATRAIRSALGRLADGDADLGRHLELTVRTGTFCRYAPDPRAPITWRL